MGDQATAWVREYAEGRDPVVRERVILAHLALADRLAARYRGRPNTSYDDLRQTARIGLITAVDRYDPDRGTPFVAFAVVTVIGQLKRHLRDATWQLCVPRTVKENVLRLAAALDGIQRGFDGWPRTEELARRVDLTEEQISQAVTALENRTVLSLDVSLEEGAPPLGHLIPDATPGGDLDERIILPELVSALPEVERTVVVLYYFSGLNQREIGALIGCSQMQVSRLLRRSRERLHDQLVAADSPGPRRIPTE